MLSMPTGQNSVFLFSIVISVFYRSISNTKKLLEELLKCNFLRGCRTLALNLRGFLCAEHVVNCCNMVSIFA